MNVRTIEPLVKDLRRITSRRQSDASLTHLLRQREEDCSNIYTLIISMFQNLATSVQSQTTRIRRPMTPNWRAGKCENGMTLLLVFYC